MPFVLSADNTDNSHIN